jgi:hypothetical protein
MKNIMIQVFIIQFSQSCYFLKTVLYFQLMITLCTQHPVWNSERYLLFDKNYLVTCSWGFGAELHKRVVSSDANIYLITNIRLLDIIHHPVFI